MVAELRGAELSCGSLSHIKAKLKEIQASSIYICQIIFKQKFAFIMIKAMMLCHGREPWFIQFPNQGRLNRRLPIYILEKFF